MIPKGSDPNGIIFEKEYQWGQTPMVLFCTFLAEKALLNRLESGNLQPN